MTYLNKYRSPGQLTGTARGAFRAQVERYRTARLLPSVSNLTLDYEFSNSQSVLPPAAQFRSFNSESMVNTLVGGQKQSGKLPPISIRMHVDEWTQLQLMNADAEMIGAKFDEYAIANAQSIASRAVIAQAEAIVSGKVTLADRGLNLVIDFGRKAGLTATAATLWSAAGADPLADLDALQQVMDKPITEVWVSRTILGHLQRNAKVIELVTRGVGTATIVSPQDVVSVFAAWNFPLIVVDDVITDATGNEVPLIDPKQVVLISGTSIGSTQLGVTAEAVDPTNGISKSSAPGLFAGAAAQDDPHGYNVFAGAIVLPVANRTDSTASLKVLA